jgi:hypothetical protein
LRRKFLIANYHALEDETQTEEREEKMNTFHDIGVENVFTLIIARFERSHNH